MALIVERALFVVAPQDSGKSTVLRSLFLDRRLGMEGKPPSGAQYKKLPDTYWLSNERRLYLRLTSPHEYGESLEEFIGKTEQDWDTLKLQPSSFLVIDLRRQWFRRIWTPKSCTPRVEKTAGC